MGVSAESSESGKPPRRTALGAGRSGRVRSALRLALEEARQAERMTPEHEVRALLAERYADLVDRAARDADGAGLLRAGDKLTELMDTLPIRTTSGGGGSGDSGDGGRGTILQLMDSPPAVGDSANS